MHAKTHMQCVFSFKLWVMLHQWTWSSCRWKSSNFWQTKTRISGLSVFTDQWRCASVQYDGSHLWKAAGSLILHVDTESFCQTALIHRMIWTFACQIIMYIKFLYSKIKFTPTSQYFVFKWIIPTILLWLLTL